MTRKLETNQIDDAISLYLSGLSCAKIAARLGVTATCISVHVRKAGVTRSTKEAHGARVSRGDGTKDRIEFPLDEAIARYAAGESVLEISASMGVNHCLIYKRFKRAGVAIRTKASAGTLMRQKASTARAKTEAAGQHVGWGEEILARWLQERGEDPIHQFPVGVRNIDLAISPVAVEVWLSSWSPLEDPYCRDRIKYLADRGWSTCYILVSRRTRTLVYGVTDQVVAMLERARANPAPVREHRVIRGCGEVAAIVGDDLNHGPLMPTSMYCPHHRPGHYGISG